MLHRKHADFDEKTSAWHAGQSQSPGRRVLGGGSAASGVNAINVFDRSIHTPWVSSFSASQVIGQAWIGWDFGQNTRKMVCEVEIEQWDGGQAPNTIKTVLLQASHDKFNSKVTTVQELMLNENEIRKTVKINTSIAARYWRVLATSQTNGGHWGIKHLKFNN